MFRECRLEISQLRRLKELEEENAKLKRMYANLALDNDILREVIGKKLQEPRAAAAELVCADMTEANPSLCKTLEPGARKEIAREIIEERKISITRACSLMEIHKSFFRYGSRKDDSEIEAAIRSKAKFDSDGFWKIYHLLRNEGRGWNHKRVYRVYKGLKFNRRVPLRRRLPARVKNPLTIPERENITWSMDFVTDVLQSGRKFRVLNVIDDGDRVAVAQKIAPSMPAERVIRLLEEIIWEKGKPVNIRCDNGPEFISHVFQDWCMGNGINILYTQPGCPMQNGYIERFNGSYRRAVLDAYIVPVRRTAYSQMQF